MGKPPLPIIDTHSTPSRLGAAGKGIKKCIAWLVVLAVFGAAFYWLLPRKGEKKPVGAQPVAPLIRTAQAKQGDIGVFLEAIGTVTPVYTAQIQAQVTGVVEAVRFTEGEVVAKGAPLIEIDARLYEANLKQAEGALERDQQLLAQARMDLQRYRDAWARNAIARQQLEDQEKLVLQQEGVVKLDQGNLDFNKAQVAYCHIAAPFAGRVGLRFVDPGNLITTGASAPVLCAVTQLQPITVVFSLAEDHIGEIQAELRKGSKLAVHAYDRSSRHQLACGELTALDNQIDPSTGTLKLRATFANEDLRLFANQFVNARLLLKTLPAVTLVPSAAIQQNGTHFFVYVIAEERAHVCPVQPGPSENGYTQVTGVQPGETIADTGFEKLREGAAVRIAPEKK